MYVCTLWLESKPMFAIGNIRFTLYLLRYMQRVPTKNYAYKGLHFDYRIKIYQKYRQLIIHLLTEIFCLFKIY